MIASNIKLPWIALPQNVSVDEKQFLLTSEIVKINGKK
jgi:hypothetical protein